MIGWNPTTTVSEPVWCSYHNTQYDYIIMLRATKLTYATESCCAHMHTDTHAYNKWWSCICVCLCLCLYLYLRAKPFRICIGNERNQEQWYKEYGWQRGTDDNCWNAFHLCRWRWIRMKELTFVLNWIRLRYVRSASVNDTCRFWTVQYIRPCMRLFCLHETFELLLV